MILTDACAPSTQTSPRSTLLSRCSLIVANGVGKTLGYTRLRRIFAAAARQAKVDDVTPHTCRHTFASILIDQGADVEFLSDQLGHSSTNHLGHLRAPIPSARARGRGQT